MKSILLSIKPSYAKEIYAHRKHIELRKRQPNVPFGTPVYMYETLPIGKITGIFVYMGCIVEGKESFWKRYGDLTCITKEEFFDYYKDVAFAYGWKIGHVVKFEKNNTLGVFDKEKAPQSYAIVYPTLP